MVTSINLRHRKPPHKADEVVRNKDDSRQLESLVLTFPIVSLLRFLKFRPTPRPPTARVFDRQVQDLCRSVHLHYKYANQPDDTDFNPKLYAKSSWNPPQEDPNLEERLYSIRQDLLENFNPFPSKRFPIDE